MPAYNERNSVSRIIDAVHRTSVISVIVVDDASEDDTAAQARKAGAHVISLPCQLGAWGATQTGIRAALKRGFDRCVTMDADGQHPAECISELINAQQSQQANVVIGACVSRGSSLRKMAWRLLRHTSGIKVEDLTSGFRCYDLAAMRLLASRRATYLSYQDIGVLALLVEHRMRIIDIDVPMLPRLDGYSRIFRSWLAVSHYMIHTLVLGMSKRRRHAYRSVSVTEAP